MKRLSIYLTTALMAVAGLAIPVSLSANLDRMPRPVSQTAVSQQENELQQFANFKQANALSRTRTLEGVTAEEFDPAAVVSAPVVAMQPNYVMTRSAEEPGASLYGVFPTFVGANSATDACFSKIDPMTGQWSIIYRNPIYQIGQESSDYCFQSGAVRDNILYIPYFTEDMASGEYNITWRRIDIETGEILSPLKFGANLNAFFYSMAYDSSRDCFWGLAVSFSGSAGGNLVQVKCEGDPSQWYTDAKQLNMGATQGEFACNLAYNPLDNCLYSLRDNGELVYANPDRDRDPLRVIKFEKSENPYCFPTMYEACPMVYSPRDHAFIGNFIDFTAEKMTLFSIDADTYDAYQLPDLNPVGYLASLYCSDEYAVDEAPDRVENLEVILDKANLTGTYEFDMPTTTFAGLALDPNTSLKTVIEVDGTRVAIKDYLPGQHVNETYTFTEGVHHLRVYARLSTKILGPGVQVRFYSGNDNPYPAQNPRLTDFTLTWNAPRVGGVHGGYVEEEAMTYDVFVNGVKSNPTPLTECTYIVPEPSVQTRCNITVRALVNGKYSEDSALISRVLGPALELPQSFAPTSAQADLFDTIDVDNDANYPHNFFRFDKVTDPSMPQWSCGTDYYYRAPNDYLFLPKMKFDDNTKQYQLSFDYRQYYDSSNWKSYVEIYLVKTMGANSKRIANIYTIESEEVLSWKNYNLRFAVPEAGDYYIVIHESSNVENKCRGSRYSHFNVQKLESTTDAPAEPTEMSVVADPNGQLLATVNFTAPTTNMRGETLPAGQQLTVTAENGDFSASTTVAPGAKGSIQIGAETSGWQRFLLTAANADGSSIPAYVLGYVGLDAPTAPRNIRGLVDDDNLGMVITWDAPSVGKNGGYVDPNNIDYPVYSRVGVSYVPLETLHNEREYHFRRSEGRADTYYVGPTAKNEMGESTGSQFVFETLGDIYPLPCTEEFNTTAFALSKWYMDTTSEFTWVQWQNASNLNTLNIGNPIPEQGLLYAINLSESAAKGHLIAPKFSTKNVEKASVNLRYWSCSSSAPMELYMRSNKDQELKKVAELKASQPLGAAWKDWKVVVPDEYLNCEWVQADLISTHKTSSVYCVIDRYSVLQEVDYDFQLTSIDAPYQSIVGENPQFSVTITNGGLEAARPELTVDLLGDGNVLESRIFNVARMNSGATYTQRVNFEMKSEYTKYRRMQVRATVKHDEDHYVLNDKKTVNFLLQEHTLPVVADLNATRVDDNNVNLTWTDPDMKISGHESFECLPPTVISNTIGQWGNVDVDKTTPFIIDGANWQNNDQPQAWTVINAQALSSMDTERFAPHSGTQFILARSAQYAQEPIPVEKWLVSPQVVGGTNVTFWYNTLSSDYTETVSVFYTTGNTDIDPEGLTKTDDGNYTSGDWQLLRHFTKSGADLWEECSFRLPADATHFAFVYRSIGMFGAMLDDIDYTPAAPGSWDFDSYEVVRSIDGNETTIATGLKTPGYTDAANNNYAADYFVQGRFNSGTMQYLSPKSNTAHVEGESSVGELFGDNTFVGGGKGYIFFGGLNGKEVAIFSLDGKLLKKISLTDDRQIVDIEKGVYTVKIGKASSKVLVK